MRTNDELRDYLCDLVHTDDASMCNDIYAVLSGDDTRRSVVEAALDQIDLDVAWHERG